MAPATAYSQRVDVIALRAQADALKDRASGHERQANELSDRLAHKRQRKGCQLPNCRSSEIRSRI